LQAVGECNRESSAVPDDAGANAGGQAGKLGGGTQSWLVTLTWGCCFLNCGIGSSACPAVHISRDVQPLLPSAAQQPNTATSCHHLHTISG
jgi:hypothetical protein